MPMLRIRETLEEGERPGGPLGDRYQALAFLGRWLSSAVLAPVLPAPRASRPRRRDRKLNALTTVLLCVAMHLWRREELSWVFRELVSGVRWLLPLADTRITRGGVSRARYRLGAAPLIALFRRLCRPLATVETPGAFGFGRRLMAIDSTVFDLADTEANEARFGRPENQHTPGAWPQAQLVALCECGTHAICDAKVAHHLADPRALARRLLRSVTGEMLVMLDQGFYGHDLFAAILAQGAAVLARVLPYAKPAVIATLADGTQLVRIVASADRRADARRAAVDGARLTLRLIRYTIDDPGRPGHGVEHRLLTSLLDPATAPALDLILAYHERWEEELAIDELATHQLAAIPLRSKRPVGVYQELYALLLAHYLVRSLMAEAAAAAPTPLDPRRLSFVGAVRLLREALPDFQRYATAAHPTITARLLAEIAATALPPRANRSNPRVVKQRCSPFPAKRRRHRHWPQPTKPFGHAVVLRS